MNAVRCVGVADHLDVTRACTKSSFHRTPMDGIVLWRMATRLVWSGVYWCGLVRSLWPTRSPTTQHDSYKHPEGEGGVVSPRTAFLLTTHSIIYANSHPWGVSTKDRALTHRELEEHGEGFESTLCGGTSGVAMSRIGQRELCFILSSGFGRRSTVKQAS
ncbi:unnamed protein product [Ectocarpus sp. 8 AP-2014]